MLPGAVRRTATEDLRALCATRIVHLLDEPLSGLDPKVTADMYHLIKELNEKDRITIIVVKNHAGNECKPVLPGSSSSNTIML